MMRTAMNFQNDLLSLMSVINQFVKQTEKGIE